MFLFYLFDLQMLQYTNKNNAKRSQKVNICSRMIKIQIKIFDQILNNQLHLKFTQMQKDKSSEKQFVTPIIPALQTIDEGILITLLSSASQISRFLRSSPTIKLQSTNKFGDEQLHQDVYCDELVQKSLRTNPQIVGFASEERPQFHQIKHDIQTQNKYIVTYDPLDGSSIIDTNFSVGTIFSIWPYNEKKLIGEKLNFQTNAVLVVYGSRTTAFLYNHKMKQVQQYTLIEKYSHANIRSDQWVLSKQKISITPKTKMFIPGNLRASTENPNYKQILLRWIDKGLTLRYTGGLVPDICQIFIKGHGIFTNIASKSHKAKLRVLYEIAAVGYLVQKAGGACISCKINSDDKQHGINLLECHIEGYDDRMGLIVGSQQEVKELIKMKCLEYE